MPPSGITLGAGVGQTSASVASIQIVFSAVVEAVWASLIFNGHWPSSVGWPVPVQTALVYAVLPSASVDVDDEPAHRGSGGQKSKLMTWLEG